MKIFVLIIGLLFSQFVYSQNITGIWRGVFYERNLKGKKNLKNENDQKFNFEVQINQKDESQIEGITYSYKTKEYYGKASFRGTRNSKLNKIYIVEQNMLDVQVDDKSDICIMNCVLNYSNKDGKEYLTGKFVSKNSIRKIECSTGDVFLEKVWTSDFKKEKFLERKKLNLNDKIIKQDNQSALSLEKDKQDSLGKKNQLNDKLKNFDSIVKENVAINKIGISDNDIVSDDRFKRFTNLLNIVTVNVTEILIEYYDNGIIDNDTITVYKNKTLVINKGRVSYKPLVINLKMDSSNNLQEVLTIADNLGEIPPNTALMVVTAGENRYEIPISIDNNKNAKVIFEYKKNEKPKLSIIRAFN